MKKMFITMLLPLATALSLIAQQGSSLSASVYDEAGNPLDFANAILHAASDSALVKAEYTAADGAFAMQGLRAGRYWLEVSYVGLASYRSDVFVLAEGQAKDLGRIVLGTAGEDLSEVLVTARKPLVEVRPDKTVFNVESSVSAVGSDALELLRMAPSVVVDNNDNITLAGKSGVRVFIDGKPSPLNAADLAQFLRSMRSSEIEAIEIITNPGARFEAEGNAGIINIRLKKNKNLGTNGSIEAGYGIGVRPKYDTGLSLNYRDDKANVFGKYSYNMGHWYSFQNILRRQLGTRFDQRGVNWSDNANHNFRLGADFFLSEQHTIGVLASGFLSDNHNESLTRTVVSNEGSGAVEFLLDAGNLSEGQNNNANLNLNYRYDNKQGRILNVDADYSRFDNVASALQPNAYLSPNANSVTLERNFANETPVLIQLYALKADYEQNLWGGKFSGGGKFSYVSTDNTFDFFEDEGGVRTFLPERSNNFVYIENVNAAYAAYDRALGKAWNLQAGLRMEHTHSRGELSSAQQVDDQVVERDYVDWFPSGGLTFQASPQHSWRLSYSYRIDRPRYQDLNPFEWQLSELNFRKGNPFLRPQYTHNLELGHTFMYRFNTSINYSQTSDLVAQITDTLNSQASFITQLNIARQRNISLNLSAPFDIAPWWSVYANATLYHVDNEGEFGGAKVVDVARTAFNTFVQNSFTLPAGLTGEISGFYNSPAVWGGNFRTNAMWGINAGLGMKLFGGAGRLKINVSDIFLTQRWRGYNDFGALAIDANGGWESRRLSVNFSYNFGNENVRAARRRDTALDSEKNRASGGE